MRRLALACLAVSLAAACSSPPTPLELEVPLGFGETWEHFADVAERSGFRMDPVASDRGLRIFISRWRESPAPFGKGVRTRLQGRFERVEPKPEHAGKELWRLEYFVERQIVTDISRGFEAEEDDWSDDGQDGEREQILLGQLRLRYGQALGIQPRSAPR